MPIIPRPENLLKGGKVKVITKKQLLLVTRLASRGVREFDIARACEMSYNTWKRCKREQPEVEASFDAGRQMLHDALVGKGVEKALAGDSVMIIWLMKTLYGYRENDAPTEQRATIVFKMPDAQSAEGYRPPVLNVPAPAALLPSLAKGSRRG